MTTMRSPHRRGSIAAPAERVPVVTPQTLGLGTEASPARLALGSPPKSLLQRTLERRRSGSVSFETLASPKLQRTPERRRSGSVSFEAPRVLTASPARPCYFSDDRAQSLLLGSLRKSLTISERRDTPPKRPRCFSWSDDDSFLSPARPSPRRASGSRSALAAYLAFDSPEPPKRSPTHHQHYLDLAGQAPPPPALSTPVRSSRRVLLDAYRTPPTRRVPFEPPAAVRLLSVAADFEPPSDDGDSSSSGDVRFPDPPAFSPPRPNRPHATSFSEAELAEALVAFTAAAPTTPRVLKPKAVRAVGVDLSVLAAA